MGTRRLDLPRLQGHAAVWLMRGTQPALGVRQLAILEAVRDAGSLNAAAKQLRMSYRHAWATLRQAEAALGVPLTAVRIGGRRGGGSCLTAAGEQIVARLRGFQREQEHAAAQAAATYFGTRAGAPAARRAAEHVRLGTTTSAVDTGLLSVLLEPFARRAGVEVEVVPVGSGAALQLARAGRVDVVLAHAPADEERRVAAGDLVNRRQVMANAFVLVGPADDPAGVRRAGGVYQALQRIASRAAPFVSRGDGSGTHQREQALLAASGVRTGAWYQQHRAGMAETLRRADRGRAYALADYGTFAAVADELALEILADDLPELSNYYSVLAANPHRHPEANYLAAMALIGWLTAPPAQEIIAAYRIGGRQVATSAAEGRRATGGGGRRRVSPGGRPRSQRGAGR